jgi:hypothetical protein
MNGSDPAGPLIAAVRQTLLRGCGVRLRMQTAIPMMDDFAPALSDGVRWTGAADFLSDRARLTLDTGELRFDGRRSYTLMGDGRWQLVEGEVGSWGMFHPRYPLEAILQARERVVLIGEGRFRVTGEAEPQAWMVLVFQYEPVDQRPTIDLPATADTVTAADWIGEQETHERSPGG